MYFELKKLGIEALFSVRDTSSCYYNTLVIDYAQKICTLLIFVLVIAIAWCYFIMQKTL